jgi:hypothetical protein
LWGQVVDLEEAIFRRQGDLTFRGSIRSDGVSITITKQDRDSTAKQGPVFHKKSSDDEEYILLLPPPNLREFDGRCVLIDPGRRDLMVCTAENSTPESPKQFRYSVNEQAKDRKTRKYSRIKRNIQSQDPNVNPAVASLALFNRKTTDTEEFARLLEEVRDTEQKLIPHFSNLIYRKLRLNAYTNSKMADQKLAKNIRQKFSTTQSEPDGTHTVLDPVLVIRDWNAGMANSTSPLQDSVCEKCYARKALKFI